MTEHFVVIRLTYLAGVDGERIPYKRLGRCVCGGWSGTSVDGLLVIPLAVDHVRRATARDAYLAGEVAA